MYPTTCRHELELAPACPSQKAFQTEKTWTPYFSVRAIRRPPTTLGRPNSTICLSLSAYPLVSGRRAHAQAGEALGVESLVKDLTQTATARAVGQSVVLSLNRTFLEQQMKRNSALEESVLLRVQRRDFLLSPRFLRQAWAPYHGVVS